MLDLILSEKLNPVLFSDETRKEEGDYKFYYENNILIKYGKKLTGEDITGEYVGIAKLNKIILKDFKIKLDELINNQEHGLWWEDVLYRISDETKKVYIRDVNKLFWAEVDYIEDYQRIMEYIKK